MDNRTRSRRPGASLILAALLVALTSGCAASWQRVETTPATGPADDFTVELPVGWMQITDPPELVATRDGERVQRISLQSGPLDKAFGVLERTATQDMLPSELAELTISQFKATSLPDLDVLANEPARIADRDGFRLHFQSINERGLSYEHLVYGCATPERFYLLWYRAPTLHYFGRDSGTFEQVVESFRLGPST